MKDKSSFFKAVKTLLFGGDKPDYFTLYPASKDSESLNMEGSTWRLKRKEQMAKVIKDTKSGLYFVEKQGFNGTVALATRFDTLEAASATVAQVARFGIVASIENAVEVDANIKQNADGTSFAVSFIRAKDLNSDGSIKTNKRNPSARRFATKQEAVHHGSRYVTIEKHLGFYVTTTKDPVNAYVNKVTGFTNPEIGKKRLERKG